MFYKRILVILFAIFQKLRDNYIEDMLEFIDRKAMCNKTKMSLKILAAIFIFYHIDER